MSGSESALSLDPHLIEEVRVTMFKFALLQLGDKHTAEDMVQEAILGALKNNNQFQGGASYKTWLFAILKNKIIDFIRHRKRTITISSLTDDEEANLDELFDQKGEWLEDEKPKAWVNPEQHIQDKQFWVVFELCLERLPKNQAQLFMMREYLGFETKEIESSLGLSTSNVNVLLYRARLRLRECLENNWFAN
ncbi:MAG: sigma-70 family RNA polymerase sigma factor [Betaproteobacteria bacterium]|nr:sigma-70 family RNA polymerase sigma factor [Betaproteobacteria bacterium]MDE2057013.1 sigma-70 family RNA polymerase sigma factor [Betaproteobacteria bacterium]